MYFKKLITECIGSFFLVLAITMCTLGGSGNLAPIGIGLMLMGLVYAGGHISGAHYNPAVTLSVFLRGKCSASEVPGYIIAQLIGASLAAIIGSYFLLGKEGTGLDLSLNAPQAILAEMLGTFALCFVVLNVATAKDTEGNSFYGLGIGVIFTACTYVFSGISGGAFNPGIALGMSISNISGWSNLWIYVVGEVIGAIFASYVFLLVNGKE